MISKSKLKLGTDISECYVGEYYEKVLDSTSLYQFDYNLYRVFNTPEYAKLSLKDTIRESTSTYFTDEDSSFDNESELFSEGEYFELNQFIELLLEKIDKYSLICKKGGARIPFQLRTYLGYLIVREGLDTLCTDNPDIVLSVIISELSELVNGGKLRVNDVRSLVGSERFLTCKRKFEEFLSSWEKLEDE